MTQIHKSFTAEQVKVLLSSYEQGYITRNEIENTLHIGKTRFFALLKQYRNAPHNLTLEYRRTSHRRLGAETEEKIKSALLAEKELVDNKELPIRDYNYAALKDRLQKNGVKVSTTTIIKRASELGCYQPKKKKKAKHDREVVTDGCR